ncbi:MAG: ankyrin repeat domain-containing protein [Bacteroidales bacterium]|nr:ankyrin repeat domain-containing protein [Bacteroidales bacterium]
MTLTIFILFLIISVSGKENEIVSEKEVLHAIAKGNTMVVEQFVKQGNDINGFYHRSETTLLNYSVKRKSMQVFNHLLALGADPDMPSQGLTPIMHAIRHGEMSMIHRLLRIGANIDATAKGGQTALIYAAKLGKFEFVRTLIEWGADAEIRNNRNQSALDIANLSNQLEIAVYLVKIIELRHLFAGLPVESDGPHIEWANDTMVRMFYMITDIVRKYPVLHCDFFPATGETIVLKGFAGDPKDYYLIKNKDPDNWDFQNVSKVLALGDIHGHYSAFKKYLIQNGVINENLDWTYGDGHLVLLGDLFDRGDQVTESLWLIHQLDIKSRQHGGRVHMILGNHEVMAMINDIRYISRKYKQFSNYFSREYADFYNRKTELGLWLRNKSAVVRINDCIFSHAGISSEIIKHKFTIPRINFLLQNFLANDPQSPNRFPKETNIILGKWGPLWYRGFLYDFPDVALITQDEVNDVLKTMEGSKLVIAHSHVETISAMYNNAVIAIDVPVHKSEVISEGLLIENGKYYRLLHNGEKILLLDK